jgi:hypothetical protein
MSPENGILLELLCLRGGPGDDPPHEADAGGRPMRGKLHDHLRGARFKHALGQTETLIACMFTALATVFVWLNAANFSLPGWAWIAVVLLGLAAVSILIATAITDPESIADSVTSTLADYFKVEGIADATIRTQIIQAMAHRARMEEVLFRSSQGTRNLVSDALSAVDDWLSGMGRLALRLETFQTEFHLQSETRLHLLERIDNLERRIGESSDKRTKDQLRETMAGRRHQLRAIEELESLIERGLLRLEHAAAALGTIHAQLAMFTARGEEQGDAVALAQDINAEIREIDAVLAALDRVYAGSHGDDSVDRGTLDGDRLA